MNWLAQSFSLMTRCTGRTASGYEQCDFCDLIRLLDHVKNGLVYLMSLAVAAMLIWGAFVIMTAAGNPAKFTAGRTILTNALIGFLIVVSAYLVVGELLRLAAPNSGLLPWNQIQC